MGNLGWDDKRNMTSNFNVRHLLGVFFLKHETLYRDNFGRIYYVFPSLGACCLQIRGYHFETGRPRRDSDTSFFSFWPFYIDGTRPGRRPPRTPICRDKRWSPEQGGKGNAGWGNTYYGRACGVPAGWLKYQLPNMSTPLPSLPAGVIARYLGWLGRSSPVVGYGW